jgi:hypothetical protein
MTFRAGHRFTCGVWELSLYALRLLAGRAHFIVHVHGDRAAESTAAYRDMCEQFATAPPADPLASRNAEHYGYAAYVPFGFAGAMAAYDI